MSSISSPTSRLAVLAETISRSVNELEGLLDSSNFPTPSFGEDSPHPFPEETDDVRDTVLDAAAEMYDLLLEPMALLYKKTGVGEKVRMRLWI